MKPRDTQRAKLYRAEREALSGFQALQGQEPSIEECSAFVKKVWGSPWTKRHHIGARIYPAPWVNGRGRTQARGSISYLSLPLWARTKPVMLHEIAHALTLWRTTQAAHGQSFAACFLALVRHFLGTEKAALLKAAFRKHHVRTRPKRLMSPAVFAALRARGHALAAANKRAKEEAEGPADMPWIGPGA